MNLVDIVMYLYPGEVEKGNILFQQHSPDEPIVIYEWNVPNVEKPDENELLAQAALLEAQITLQKNSKECAILIQILLDNTAQSKSYDSGLSITTYNNSSNSQWKAEAEAFIAWRDAVFTYAINIEEQVKEGTIDYPSIEQFMAQIPAIVWPQ